MFAALARPQDFQLCNKHPSAVPCFPKHVIVALASLADILETSLMGSNLKDLVLRSKYFIALSRVVLQVPRKGSGYERTLEDLLGN